jgi:polysaccharide biosynthesis protein PslH
MTRPALAGCASARDWWAARGLRVLVIDEWLPYPADMGKRVRTWNLLRRLAARHQITLLCYGDQYGEAARTVRSAGIRLETVEALPDHSGWRLYLALLANLFSPYPYSVSKHYTHRFEERLRLLLQTETFDVVHCEWTPYARFLRAARGRPHLIMAHNIECQIWFRRARQDRSMAGRAFFGLQARKMRWFERRALSSADWVATVTALDAEQARRWGVRQVAVVENGVDLDRFTSSEDSTDSSELLFIGSLDSYSNLDALGYLLDEILPLIRARLPGARLQIVGSRPPAWLQKRVAPYPAVELVGEVRDVRPFLARAAAVVVPLRIGGGSRVRILEAFAMRKAVVSTSIGAEGLAAEDGVHLLLADTPSLFASRTVELLRSPEQRRRLGENGRHLALSRHSWDQIAQALESAWLQACDASSSLAKVIVIPSEEQAHP